MHSCHVTPFELPDLTTSFTRALVGPATNLALTLGWQWGRLRLLGRSFPNECLKVSDATPHEALKVDRSARSDPSFFF